MARYDVAVSGGGPAGAFAALLCARKGLRTALIERAQVPRVKCCAGGVLERSLRLIDKSLPGSVAEKDIFGTALIHGSRSFEFRSKERVAVTVQRERFDQFIVDLALAEGCMFLESTEVRKVTETGSGVELLTSSGVVEARGMVIAEGATSRSAQQLLGPRPPGCMGIGMAAHCEFEEDPGDLLEFHLTERPEMPFLAGHSLDGWMFPHQRGGNVGVAGRGASTEHLQRFLNEVVGDLARRRGVRTVGKVRAHPIPVLPRPRLSSQCSVAVGDAAGLASPMTGEGISYGLQSAVVAAECMDALINRPGYDLRSFDRRMRAEVLPMLRAARWVGTGLQSLSSVVDVDTLLDKMRNEDRIIASSIAMSTGDRPWTDLLARTIPRFPYLFFSSLR